MDKKVMDAMAEAADLLLKARGPLYKMSEYEARSRMWALEREKRVPRVYICSQYGSRGDMITNLELAKAYCMAVIEEGKIPVCRTSSWRAFSMMRYHPRGQQASK